MKRILAIIRPNMLDDVIFALHKLENFPGATMTEVRGMGRSFSKHVKAKKRPSPFGYPVQARIEIVCTDEQVENIVSTIEQNARTGRTGDGKIFIAPIEDAVRVRTGERENTAIK